MELAEELTGIVERFMTRFKFYFFKKDVDVFVGFNVALSNTKFYFFKKVSNNRPAL